MIQITPQMRILLAVEPVDFRKGIDGLVALCRQKLKSEPFEGALFVFSSRRRVPDVQVGVNNRGHAVSLMRLGAVTK